MSHLDQAACDRTRETGRRGRARGAGSHRRHRALVYGLVEAGNTGWSAAGTLLPLGAGLGLLGVFVAVERVATPPLVDRRLLATRPVAAGYGVMLA